MGTLSERLADVVACGSRSADRLFDVGWSSRSAVQSTHSILINRESSTASNAIGAERFRDSATLALSL
jgi:hypothetical protein